ncbi:MAG TPA: M48 family metallopeptidase [Steroidobacteraceae bacterium]|jgi:Zn-dependent protease with chaperone function|nr:M48 family metallopeptidase [Steroidobacteraceae bacterium]
MNFFKRQDEARRASRRLVVLFGLAVVAVVAAVDLVVFLLMRQGEARAHGYVPPLGDWLATHPGTVVGTTLAVLAVIAIASFYKTMLLGGGGGVVARSLGGVRVSPDTSDPQQRRLLNVVEEMAIASGVPMPEVYLLEHESGINAFAAGHNPSNAAIGVTHGTLTTLNRAELQGVIAHEFSHILNGDMKLNVRLMGLLFGLLVIALIGRTVLRGATRVRSDRKGGVLVVLLIAVAVLIIGYIGLFFGRLIQAAVSRSREALADASAVQFTRDPSGLRGALVKIGASAAGSRVANPEVEEVAHMLFAPGMSRFFATHPPLLERLKAIDPRFDPQEIERARANMAAQLTAEAVDETPAAQAKAAEYVSDLPAAAPSMVAQLVGNPGTAHMQLAREIRQSLPGAIVAAGRHAESARALLLALALDSNPETRAKQKQVIAQRLSAEIAAATAALERDVDALEPEQRIPALLRGFPALRQLTHEARVQLMACLNGMLLRDGNVALHTYVLRKLAQMHLRDDLDPGARTRRLTLDVVQRDAQVLFSVLAQHGHSDATSARRAYEAGMHRLFPRERPAYGVAGPWAAALDLALSRLDQLAPIAKEQLVEAMVATVTHDQQLTIGEAELLRAVCASVHCPLPPLVAT